MAREDYTEIFEPRDEDRQESRRVFYTVKSGDIGKRVIHTTVGPILTDSFAGRIQPQDVGRRIYRVAANGSGYIWQMENSEQHKRRTYR